MRHRALALTLLAVVATPALAADMPIILRGEAAKAPPPRQPAAPATRAVAGDVLWLVDPADGTVTVCRLRSTTQVGVERVRCREGRLD